MPLLSSSWLLLGRSWLPRWPHNGPKMAPESPKMAPRSRKMAPRWPQDGPKMAPRWPQYGPRWPQDGPKMAPDPESHETRALDTQAGPKMAPRWPQGGPRWPQDGPRWPKTAQDATPRPSSIMRPLLCHSLPLKLLRPLLSDVFYSSVYTHYRFGILLEATTCFGSAQIFGSILGLCFFWLS